MHTMFVRSSLVLETPFCSLRPLMLLALWTHSCVIHSQGYTFNDQRDLIGDLFINYSKNQRPFVNETAPLQVYLGVWLVSIVDLEAVNQRLKFSATLYMEWVDHNLVWDPADYNGITHFAYPQSELWIPDLTILNSVETLAQLGFDRNALGVLANGTVFWTPSGVFSTSCYIEVTYYPFDTQKCKVVFSTVVSTYKNIDLFADDAYSVMMDYYSPSGIWEVVGVDVETTEDANGRPTIIFSIRLRRLRTFYVISLIAPVLFLAFTATLVFALPPESGEKMGTSITVLLAYAVYLSIISGQIPTSSLHVSFLSVYVTFLLGITALGVVLTVWILNIHFRDDKVNPPSVGLSKFVIRLQKLTYCRRRSNVVNNSSQVSHAAVATIDSVSDVITNEKGRNPVSQAVHLLTKGDSSSASLEGDNWRGVTWKMVSEIFDQIFFYSFSLLLLAATVTFLIVLLSGNDA